MKWLKQCVTQQQLSRLKPNSWLIARRRDEQLWTWTRQWSDEAHRNRDNQLEVLIPGFAQTHLSLAVGFLAYHNFKVDIVNMYNGNK